MQCCITQNHLLSNHRLLEISGRPGPGPFRARAAAPPLTGRAELADFLRVVPLAGATYLISEGAQAGQNSSSNARPIPEQDLDLALPMSLH